MPLRKHWTLGIDVQRRSCLSSVVTELSQLRDLSWAIPTLPHGPGYEGHNHVQGHNHVSMPLLLSPIPVAVLLSVQVCRRWAIHGGISTLALEFDWFGSTVRSARCSRLVALSKRRLLLPLPRLML
ncbi:hypothetical protein M407DRAFT_247217, partial [Tulasnella calospora MUT 4182]